MDYEKAFDKVPHRSVSYIHMEFTAKYSGALQIF